MIRFYLTTLGCKLNQAEIDAMARRIVAAGHQVTSDAVQADWAVVNTCAVTHVAAGKSRRAIRHLARLNPQLRIAVVGCYAELAPERIAAVRGVSLILPNADKESVLSYILASTVETGGGGTAQAVVPTTPRLGRPETRTRAFVKIQDGCDNHCTYCVVTIARGPARSRPIGEILDEIDHLLDEGYREVVLTGVNIGAYGQDRGADGRPLGDRRSLALLVEEILARTSVPRLRLSSIEPWDVTPQLLALWQDGRVCRHLHLPLQSGSEATLRRMGRNYSLAEYSEIVARARQAVPEISITTDVIVAFPGETETEFAESTTNIERSAFSRLHVFRFSGRPGTAAARMPDQVSPDVSQARSQELIALGRRLAAAYHQLFVGRDIEVLFESATAHEEEQKWSGLTDNYLRVSTASKENLANQVRRVRCLSADEAGIEGILL